MAKCANENCKNDPSRSMNAVIVSTDGDKACCPECKRESERQMDHFCRVTLANDNAFAAWMGVPVELVKSDKTPPENE